MDDPQMINVAVSHAIQRFILVTNNDMLHRSRHIRDLVGYIRYHNPGEDVVDSAVVSVFDLLYRAYSQRLRPLAARLRQELKYPSEDIIWTVLQDIIAEERYAHMKVISQVLLRNLLTDLGGPTPAQLAYLQHRASVDFVVYNWVTNGAGGADDGVDRHGELVFGSVGGVVDGLAVGVPMTRTSRSRGGGLGRW